MGLPGSAALARRIPLSDLRPPEGVASAPPAVRVCRLWPPDVRHGWDDLPGHPQPAHRLVSGDVGRHQSEDRDERADAAAGAGLGQLPNGLDLAAQAATGDGAARPGDRLAGYVEVDETFVGGVEDGVSGRGAKKKALIAVAAEDVGQRLGRIRLRRVPDASANSLQGFIDDVVEPGSQVHTDGWLGYERVQAHGYRHRITYLSEHPEPANQLLPRVHLVTSLLKRWLLGTHQGAVSPAHLDYYLDEFTFRFNRRRSRHRGMLFYRLAQQAVQVAPVPYTAMVKDVGRGPRRDHKM